MQFKRVWHWIVLGLGLSFVWTVFLTWPLLWHLSDSIPGTGGDAYQFLGFQNLNRVRFESGLWLPSHTTWWRYPAGFELQRGADGMLINSIGGLLSLAFQNSVLAFNTTILLALVANGWASYGWFYYLTGSKRLGILGQLGFGFSWYVLARATGHLNLVLVSGFPLLLWSSLSWWKKPSWFRAWLVAGSVMFITVSSIQYTIMTIIVGLVSLASLWLFSKTFRKKVWHKLRAHSGQILVPAITTSVLVGLLIWPFVLAGIRHDFVWRTAGDYSPSLLDWLLPNPASSSWLANLSSPTSSANIERVVFMGWIESFLVLLGLGWSLTKPKLRPWAVVIAACWLCALGTVSPETGLRLPYYWLHLVYPFKAISEPGRFVVPVLLLGLSLGLLWLSQRKKPVPIWLVLGLIVVMTGSRSPWPGLALSPKLDGEYVQAVRETPSSAVLDIPTLDERLGALSLYYHKPIVGGYMHWTADTRQARSFIDDHHLDFWKCDQEGMFPSEFFETHDETAFREELYQALRENDITTLVVHKNFKLYWPGCEAALGWTSWLVKPIRLAKATGSTPSTHTVHWTNQPMNTGLFFPQTGVVELVTLNYSFPADGDAVQIRLNDEVFPSETWNYTESDSIWISPKPGKGRFEVVGGTELVFSTQKPIKRGFLTAVYRYHPKVLSPIESWQYKNLKKIFEDDDKIVIQLIANEN